MALTARRINQSQVGATAMTWSRVSARPIKTPLSPMSSCLIASLHPYRVRPGGIGVVRMLGVADMIPPVTRSIPWAGWSPRRMLHVEAFLLPPLVFTGLLAALWTWKCTMMVVCQNKIIYMPGLPPGTRKEQIQDYAGDCGGVKWEEVSIRSDGNGPSLILAVAEVGSGRTSDAAVASALSSPSCHVYLLYFQGNAASTPPRLPALSAVLRAVQGGSVPGPENEPRSVRHTIACVSYRGYWKSKGRPSERGINRDAVSALRWVSEAHARTYVGDALIKPIVILWGQSIGAGFATNLLAYRRSLNGATGLLPVTSVILETPFLSVRAMLETLYPQKWLPYRYLWPFLRNHLDSWGNLGLASTGANGATEGAKQDALPRFLLVVAERDELVPRQHGVTLFERCESLGFPVEIEVVQGAYHNEASWRPAGRNAIAAFVRKEIAAALKTESGEN